MKKRLIEEFYRFLFYFLFLFTFLSAFIIYKRILLREYNIVYTGYGFALIESIFLAKIIMIGEIFGLNKRFPNKSLFVQILYDTLVFSIFVLIFAIIEQVLDGFYRGLNIAEIYNEFVGKHIFEILSNLFIMLFVLVPFFSILEIANIIGNQKFLKIIFKKP